jgi:hypothetical protein
VLKTSFWFTAITGVLVGLSATPGNAATVTPTDPNPAGGISYEWKVKLNLDDTASIIRHVGAKSWNEPENPPGLKGWTHTSDWVALDLTESAYLTIKIKRASNVTVDETTIAGNQLYPAFSLYSGWENNGVEDHQYNNLGNTPWAPDITYVDSNGNDNNTPAVYTTFKLEPGFYSIAIGGNPPDPTQEGRQGYEATFGTSSVPEPSSMGAIALSTGMLFLFKRQGKKVLPK